MYVLTNGTHYIVAKGNTFRSTNVPGDALLFETKESALKAKSKAPGRTKSYGVVDVETGEIVVEAKATPKAAPKSKKSKQKRKHYSEDVRKLVYMKDDGVCQLCGRKISLEDMTLDHITPLAMNGKDDVENLQCTCLACNQFKGSILPDEFNARISEIFMYQMEKRNGNRLRWKLACKLMTELNEN